MVKYMYNRNRVISVKNKYQAKARGDVVTPEEIMLKKGFAIWVSGRIVV